MPRQKSTTTRPGTKLDFISRHPNMSAAELVLTARAKGLTLTVPQIHTARTILRKRGISSAPRRARGAVELRPPIRVGRVVSVEPASTKAQQLLRLILELGFDRARDIFNRAEVAFEATK